MSNLEGKERMIFELIDYPHCAVCANTEQYNDDTFICTINNYPDNPDDPLPYEECDELEVCSEYLVGYLTLLTKLIKELRETKV